MSSYANPQNLNRYSYVTNNPLRYTDPTGHVVACNPMEGDCHHDSPTSGNGTANGNNHRGRRHGGADDPDPTNGLIIEPIPDAPDTLPLSETSKAMFDNFRSYCRDKNYACGDTQWPYQLNPFDGVDPDWLARYESEVLPTYAAQGIDLNSIVQQHKNNPLNMDGLKNTVAMFYTVKGKSNPVYPLFLNNVGLDPKSPANREIYYLVKMIEQNQDAFRDAIDQCGSWCTGK